MGAYHGYIAIVLIYYRVGDDRSRASLSTRVYVLLCTNVTMHACSVSRYISSYIDMESYVAMSWSIHCYGKELIYNVNLIGFNYVAMQSLMVLV